MAAFSLIFHLLKPGEHIIANEEIYGGSTNYLLTMAKEQSVLADLIDLRDIKSLEKTIKPNTKMVMIETPSNPSLRVLDIKAIADICKDKKITFVVDNTFLSPYNQNPLELGADIVMHSCTKYIGGHSDLIMGAMITSEEELYKKMKTNSILLGCCPGPNDCFLASRGLKTLKLRVECAQNNAMKLAELLEKHPKISEVIYPGLPAHPGHELLKKQSRGFGSMITIKLKDGEKAGKFYNALTLFGHAVSLGGVESLVSLPTKVTHKCLPEELKVKLGITDCVVRLAIGVEDFEDLRDDLLHALEVA